MYHLENNTFQQLINDALDSLNSVQAKNIQNIAFLVQDEPTPQQREQLKLRDNETLFGLYEGVPLPKRMGISSYLPDKITLFQGPLERASSSLVELRENVRHTLWHEIGHYYGLDHKRIRELES